MAVVPGTAFTLTGLANGTTYYFEVVGVGTAGQSAPSVQVAATPTRPALPPGYRVASTGGEIFTLGKASSYPSGPSSSPVVAIASTPDGRGYWLALKDGGVVAAGDAHLYGSLAGKHLGSAVAALAALWNSS